MATPPLPPLNAVRVFEAAARLGSFTAAACELGMTQAAVSYQIKLLEGRLGQALFLRQPRQVVLSEAGRRLSPAVSDAFEALRAAFAAAHEDAAGVLAISAVSTFASNWLAPRLGAFQLANPQLAVRLEVSQRMVDFAREEIDLGIRMGGGDWPGLEMTKIASSRFTPMCSPSLLERHGEINAPIDLLRLPLLSADDPWWPAWFALAGITAPELATRPGLRLDSQQMLGSAAIAGQGVTLLDPALFAADLAAGRLVRLFDLVAEDGYDYWLVYPSSRRNAPKIRAFRAWLLGEVARAGGDAAG